MIGLSVINVKGKNTWHAGVSCDPLTASIPATALNWVWACRWSSALNWGVGMQRWGSTALNWVWACRGGVQQP